MKKIAALTFLLLPPALAAGRQTPPPKQKPVMVAEDGDLQERGSARVLYWSPRADRALGAFAIDYGRPVWRKDYDDPAKFDAMTKGKIWRLGNNQWTTLDTNLPVSIAGKAVAPGYYYLGLERSADGSSWSLAFIDPAKARREHLDAFQVERAPVEFRVPMKTTSAAGATADKLTLTLSYTKEKPKSVMLRIAWGKLVLTAPIEVTVEG
jgi:hypothetical protein